MTRVLKKIAIAAAAAAPVWCGSRVGVAGPNDFTFVTIPDTQYYTQNETGQTRFHQQTAWMDANEVSMNIRGSIGLGDVCNHGWDQTQYNRGVAAMNTIKNSTNIPFTQVPGNHDYWHDKDNDVAHYFTSNSPEVYVQNFGTSYYAGKSWYGGSSPSQTSMYSFFTGGGRTYISLGLDCDPTQAELNWAQTVINAHPDLPVIVSTHEYMDVGGRDSGAIVTLPGRLSPDTVWNNFIKTNDQIFMVVSGHNEGHNRQRSFNNYNHEVIEILTDYQGMSNNGNGFLDYYTFDPDTNKISATTYSPTLGRMLTTADDAELAGGNNSLDDTTNIGNYFFYVDLDHRFNSSDPVRRVTWNTDTSGNLSDSSKWVDSTSGLAKTAPTAGLNAVTFSGTGTYTATNDLGKTVLTPFYQVVFNNTAGTATLAGLPIDMMGGGTLVSPTITESGAGNAVISALVRLKAATTVDIGDALTFSGTITGTSNLTKNGAGVMVLAGSGQLTGLTGTINLNAGALRTATGDAISTGSTVNIAPGATLDDSYGNGEGFGMLSGSGTVLGRHNANLNVGENSSNGTFSGKITAGTNGVVGASAATRQLYFKKTINNTTVALTNTTSDFAGQTQILFGTVSVPQLPNRGLPAPLGLGDVNGKGDGASANVGIDIAIGDAANVNATSAVTKFQYTGGTASTDRTIAAVGLGGTVEITNAASALTLTSSVSGSGELVKAGAGTLLLNAASTRTGGTTVSAGTLTLGHPQATGAGVLKITTGIALAAPGLSQPLKLASLNITGGKLDLQNDKLIVQSGAAATLAANVRSGLIVDSDPNPLTSIALAANADLGKSTFGGVGVLTSDVLAMTTYIGDANLSGFIDADDYFAIDSNYGKAAAAMNYARGDFNYDGRVDGDDFAKIDASFAGQTTAYSTAAGVSSVPEPSAVALSFIAVAGLLRRSRRHQS